MSSSENSEDEEQQHSSLSESAAEDSSSTSSSDDDDNEIEEFTKDKDFLKTLSYLKNKNPQIYDKNIEFFTNNDDDEIENLQINNNKKKIKVKPMFIKDYERKILLKENSFDDGDVDDGKSLWKKPLTYNEEQKTIKESFKSFINDNSDSENDEIDNNNSLLKKKLKNVEEMIKEDEDYIEWLKGVKENLEDKIIENDLKPLRDFWNNPSLDEKEEFLKDYILNKRYLTRDKQNDNEDLSDLSADEQFLVEQEQFEHMYNFRYENVGSGNETILKRYPRTIEGSLRRKNDQRKRKREELQQRKLAEKEQKRKEIKKKQKETLKQLEEKLVKLKQITGNEQLGFKDEEILEDFDLEKYNEKMKKIYDDNFYMQKIYDKPQFDWYLDDNDEEIIMDCDYDDGVAAANDIKKETRSKRQKEKRKQRRKSYKDICDIIKPTYDPEKHQTYKKYIDQYYNLDCEDFIDDLPCRFKYREVIPNDFGLSVEEILMADDKELNRWSSLKKIDRIRPKVVEKNEVKIYKEKGRNEKLKMKLLPSLFKEDEEENEEKEKEITDNDLDCNIDDVDDKQLQENTSDKKKNKRQRKKSNQNEENLKKIKIDNENRPSCSQQNKVKNNNLEKSKKNNFVNKLSDSRLLAYNIKPKQFRSKLKHGKT